MTLRNKLTIAKFATKGPFACMGANVGLKITSFAKFLETAKVRADQNFSLVLNSRNLFNVD